MTENLLDVSKSLDLENNYAQLRTLMKSNIVYARDILAYLTCYSDRNA